MSPTHFLLFSALLRGALASTVFAHFMVQNSYAYDPAQWKTDMTTAMSIGIDGFALNWIAPDCQPELDWQISRIDDAFAVAQDIGFKLMHSFDMSWTDCNIYWNQTFMQSILTKHASNDATFRWGSDILVSTYGGDNLEQYGNEFFEGLKDNMAYWNNPISLAPALTSYSSAAQTNALGAAQDLVKDYPAIDGYLNWQAWPLDVKANITASPDQAFQSALGNAGRKGPYILAVSPWQYKDLNDGDATNSWVQYSDMLFPTRFAQITSEDELHPDIIELLTWNDFTESHYLRDLPSTNETATDFVELSDMGPYIYGIDHSPWRIMAKYYISWWKYGSPPAITEDQVIYWYRIHPKQTVCIGGASAGAIRNYLLPNDAIFIWALVKEPSLISLSIGDNQFWTFRADNRQVHTNSVPFPWYVPESGITPQAAIMRGGEVIALSNGSQPISSACAWQNFNPVVNLMTVDSLST